MFKLNFSRPQLILSLLKLTKGKSLSSGYTLMELVVVCVVIGILSGMVISAKPWYENPLKNSQDRLQSVIKLARTRAMTSTSTYRIASNPDNPNEAIQIQRIRSGSCQANATLREDVASGDLTIAVNDASGFAVGDRVTVEGTEADVLSVNFGNSTLTLGSAVGEKTAGATVETVKNWRNDSAFLDEDLNVNKKSSQTEPDVSLAVKFGNTATEDWTICVNSRGLVSLFDDSGVVTDENLNLVLTNTRTNEEATVIVHPGGAMETTAIAMGSGSSGGGGTPTGGGSPTGGSAPTGGGSSTGGSELPGGSETIPTTEPETASSTRQQCNQGVGNGSDGCSPGNSDNNQPSNDDGGTAAPGSPGRAGGASNGNGNNR